jgi:cytochrome c biogenesis protein CcmG/thiol:disulfide interchange protein DsbE
VTDLPPPDLSDDLEPTGGPRASLVAAGVVGLLVVLLVVVLATRDPSTQRATQSPLLNQVAPTTAGTSLEGQPVDLADYRGRWVMLNFFASWCVPCQAEHPELAAFDAAHRAEGDAAIVGVTFDNTSEDAKAFFARHGGGWPVIDDPDNSIGVAYGVAKVPETFVISPNGVVVQRFAGAVTAADLDAVIDAYTSPDATDAPDATGEATP